MLSYVSAKACGSNTAVGVGNFAAQQTLDALFVRQVLLRWLSSASVKLAVGPY